MLTLTIIAWSVIGIQLIYLIIWLIAFSSKKVQPGTDVETPVSVIVCAHDEEENLRALVPLLLAQQYSRFEIIVVEDRCNDGTFDYLLEATASEPRLKMVRVRHLPENMNGKKYALTLGIKAASYDWVLLTDADCRPLSNKWIQSMANNFQPAKDIVVGYSPYHKLPGYLNAFIRFESLLTGIQFIGAALLNSPYMGVGRNLAYRKELFFSNKGFHKHLGLTGGDDDLFVNEHATKNNVAVTIGSDSLMSSEPKKKVRDFLYQKLRHLSVGKKYKLKHKIWLALFSITLILTWVLVVPAMVILPPLSAFVWIGFLVRELLLIILIYHASRVLGDPFEAWKTPLLDFNYAIYYLGTGLGALVSKRVRWKK